MNQNANTPSDSHREAIDDAVYLLWRSPTIDVQTTSLLTGVSQQTIYDMARKKGEALPGVKVLQVGRRVLVPTNPLRKFLELEFEPAWISGERLQAGQ